MISLKPLTRELYIRFDGSAPSVTIKGLALTDEDDVLAIIGISVFNGESFVICGTKPNASKKMIVKGWRQFSQNFMSPNKTYYALADQNIQTAPSLLKHFGFTHFKDDIYIYRG